MCWYNGGKELDYVFEQPSIKSAWAKLKPYPQATQFMSSLGCSSSLLNAYLGNWFVPCHDVSFLMVCVCPCILFRNTLMHRSARLAVRTGVQLWICLCWSLVAGELCEQDWECWGGSGNLPVCVYDPQQSNWKHLKSLSIHSPRVVQDVGHSWRLQGDLNKVAQNYPRCACRE